MFHIWINVKFLYPISFFSRSLYERRDRDGENNRKTFIDLSWSLNTCECTLSTGMPSFPVMRGRRARAVSGGRVYAACAHAVAASCAGGAASRAVRRQLATASPPLSPPLNLSVRHRNAEIGSEIFEQRRREAFREDVGELARTGDV